MTIAVPSLAVVEQLCAGSPAARVPVTFALKLQPSGSMTTRSESTPRWNCMLPVTASVLVPPGQIAVTEEPTFALQVPTNLSTSSSPPVLRSRGATDQRAREHDERGGRDEHGPDAGLALECHCKHAGDHDEHAPPAGDPHELRARNAGDRQRRGQARELDRCLMEPAIEREAVRGG